MTDAFDLSTVMPDAPDADTPAPVIEAPVPAPVQVTATETPVPAQAPVTQPPPLSDDQRQALHFAARKGTITPEARRAVQEQIAAQQPVTPPQPEPPAVQAAAANDEAWKIEIAKRDACLKYGLTHDQMIFIDADSVEGVMVKAERYKQELDAAEARGKAQAPPALPTLRSHSGGQPRPVTPKDVEQNSIAAFVAEQAKRFGDTP